LRARVPANERPFGLIVSLRVYGLKFGPKKNSEPGRPRMRAFNVSISMFAPSRSL
jgi:hypothetical protein